MYELLLERFYWKRGTTLQIENYELYKKIARHFNYMTSVSLPNESDLVIIYGTENDFVMQWGSLMQRTNNPIESIDYLLRYKELESRYFVMHAGGVARDQKAILFPANTFSGKSTLVTYLCGRGYSYISDDRVIIDISSCQIIPENKPINLRLDVLELLNGKDIGFVKDGYYDTSTERFVCIPKYELRMYSEIKAFVIPKYVGGDISKMEILNRSCAMKKLFMSSLVPYKSSLEIVTFLNRLCGRDFYNVTYSQLEYVEKVINKIMCI